MIRHDAFLDLAAVAIDFELSGAERSRLEAHLAACPPCRRSVDALHADARALAALPPERLSERRADAVLASVLRPERTAYRSLRLLAVAALLAVLAVGSILVGAELLRQRDQDDLSVVPTPPVVPSGSPVADNGIGLSWVQTVVPESARPVPGGAAMGGVIAGGPGAIAWGWVYGEGPRVWTTTDGRAWEAATIEAPTDADPEMKDPGSVTSITPGGPGFVAVGYYDRQDTGRRGLVWTSVDGRTWELQPHDVLFENVMIDDVLIWRDRLLALGRRSFGPSGGATPAVVWTSSDGRSWQQAVIGFPADVTFTLAATSVDRLWAVGRPIGSDTVGSEVETLVTSGDGFGWSTSPLPRLSGTLHAVSGGLLMLVTPRSTEGTDGDPSTGTGGETPPGIYRSTDGETWQRLSADPASVGNDLIEIEETLIMVGDDAAGDPECWADCQAMGWRSIDDGATWQAVPADRVGGTMTHVAALGDGTLVAVGHLIDGNGSPSLAAWVSQPARVPSASPTPSGPATAPDVALIVCATDGTTTVRTPVVRVQPDGVHISTTNETSEERSLDVEGIGADGAGPGTTETLWAIEPGVARVACYDPSAGPAPDDAWAELTVVDPGGTFVTTALDCTDTTVGGGSYPAGAPGWVGDPVDLTRTSLAGSHPEYVVEAAGYLMNDTRQVRVTDGGRAIARLAWVKAGSDRWLLDAVTTCGGIDLGLDLSALDRMVASPSPSPAATPSLGGDLTWERAPDQASFADAGMVSVAAGPDRYVAVGCTTPGEFNASDCVGAAWLSTDGRTWERTEVPSAEPLYLAGVITAPIGYLAWAYDVGASPGAAIWFSSDGTKWERAPTIPSFSFNHVFEVVWFHDQFVAHSDWNEKLTWVSDDGLAWRDQAGCDAPAGPAGPDPFGDSVHLIAVGEELLRVGTAYLPADENEYRGAQDYRRVITRTTAGVCSVSTTASDGWIFDIAVTGDGFVGVGRQHDLVGSGAGSPLPPIAAWTSTDGSVWSPATFSGGPPNGQLDLVASGDRGILALGSTDSGYSQWRSVDGETWSGSDGSLDEISDLAAIPEGFMAVGRETLASGNVRAVVWVAR